MLRTQLYAASHGHATLSCPLLGHHTAPLPSRRAAGGGFTPHVRSPSVRLGRGRKGVAGGAGGVRCAFKEAQTAGKSAEVVATKVKAVVTVKLTVGGILTNLGLSRWLDDITDLLGKSLFIELISAHLDPETGVEKKAVGSFVHKTRRNGDQQSYEGELTVPKGFGEVGALLVQNEHHKEMFVMDVVLSGYGDLPITFHCNSWVHPKSQNSNKRVFFSDKVK